MDWNPQVAKNLAEQDGLTADDFQWSQWPIQNLALGFATGMPDDIALVGWCDMPSEPPQLNLYDKDGNKLQDPTGIAFAMTKFRLTDIESPHTFVEKAGGYFEGTCRAGFSAADLKSIFDRLSAGSAARVHVRLSAMPLFLYNSADGTGHLEYALQNRGYFGGEEIESRLYSLSLDQDGELLIDGHKAPPREDPGETDEERKEREASDRQMAADRERDERLNREARERAERENRENDERIAKEEQEQKEQAEKAEAAAQAQAAKDEADKAAEEKRAAAERDKLGIAKPGEIYAKLTNPPNSDSAYLAFLNAWSANYAPDDTEGFKSFLRDKRGDSEFQSAVDAICSRLGWTL